MEVAGTITNHKNAYPHHINRLIVPESNEFGPGDLQRSFPTSTVL